MRKQTGTEGGKEKGYSRHFQLVVVIGDLVEGSTRKVKEGKERGFIYDKDRLMVTRTSTIFTEGTRSNNETSTSPTVEIYRFVFDTVVYDNR